MDGNPMTTNEEGDRNELEREAARRCEAAGKGCPETGSGDPQRPDPAGAPASVPGEADGVTEPETEEVDQRRLVPTGELDPVRMQALTYAVGVVASGNGGDGTNVLDLAYEYMEFLSPEDLLEPGQLPVILDGHPDIEHLIQICEVSMSTSRLSKDGNELANRLSQELTEHLAICGTHENLEF
jgi:hypothetical protein